VALALGSVRDAAQEAANLGLRAARLHEIKAYITRNLSRPTLSVPEVAEQHGVTPRYVQMLFAAEGVTFSEFVLSQRLVHAQRMLSEPVSAGRSISAIAFEAGFADLSYFNRAFRRRFGTTPSDIRCSAMGRAAKG
jgi:AraC-like DNA-binding protein